MEKKCSLLLSLIVVVLLVRTAEGQNTNSVPANFKQQMTEIIQGIRILETKEGRVLKQKLLSQIFSLYGILDKYKSEGARLSEVQAAVKAILKTISDIQAQNYEQEARVAGANNSAFGSDSSINGKYNKVHGDNSIAEGHNNRLMGDNSFTAGNKSQIIGDNAFAIGSNMNVRGDNTVAFGAKGTVKGNNKLAIDKFNIDVSVLNSGGKFLTVSN